MPITINGTTGVAGVAGSAATPAIQGTDTNTGVAFPAADTVTISTNGTEQVRVDSSGNVGIGTSAPSYKTQINNAGQTNLYLYNTANAVGLRMIADTSMGWVQTQTNHDLGFAKNNIERVRVQDSTVNFFLNSTTGNVTHQFNYNESGGEIQLIDNTGSGGILIDNTNGVGRFAKVGSGVCEVGSTGGITKVIGQGTAVAHFTATTMSVNLGGTSTATIHAFRNGTGDYNNCGLQIQDNTGNPAVGFHAGGISAYMVRHERGYGGIDSVNSNQSAFAAFRASAFNVASDYRIKENVTPLTSAIDRVKGLKPSRFNFKKGSMLDNGGKTVDGFIAHEVAEIVPEAVTGEKDAVKRDGSIDIQSLDQSKLIPLLTAALQEAVQKIEDLQARIEKLEGAQ